MIEPDNNQTSNTKQDNEVQTSENPKSKHLKNRSPYSIYKYNNIYKRQTEINQTNPSVYQQKTKRTSETADGWTDDEITYCESFIKTNINYNFLLKKFDKKTLDLIVDVILEAYNPQNETFVIQGQSLSRTMVFRQYEKLDCECIEYVLDSIREEARTKKIKNLRSYIKTCLYNAPHSIDLYYQNMVEYDFNNKL